MASKQDLRITEWQRFFKRCLVDNIGPSQFLKETTLLSSNCPLDGVGILRAWAKAHDGGFTIRARLIKCLTKICGIGMVMPIDGLEYVNATLERSIAAQDDCLVESGPAKGEWKQCTEAVILQQLAISVSRSPSTNGMTSDRLEAMRTYKPLTSLMSTYTRLASGLALLNGPALAIGNELAKYVLAYINILHVTGILESDDGNPPSELKRRFGAALSDLATVLAASSHEVADGLTAVQRQARLFKSNETERIHGDLTNDLDAMTFQQNTLDTPIVPTRASLYIYLNAMLTGPPLCDDSTLLAFLNTRYNGTADALIADLITASFDVLANAINRTEPAESINVYRSYLANKLPVLLEQFSGLLFPPSTAESCITSALHRMDPSTDPFSTQSFDLLSSSGMLSEARQDFLFACALHDLIPESSIDAIIGDVPMQSLPEYGRYNRDSLVSQCTTNSSRVEELVRELEHMEGNSSEVAGALIEIIQTLCSAKDSMTLKGVCNALLKKPQALDVLLLFAPASRILQPLCELLDNWQDIEDQGESHPVYDEFGNIFLLVLVFKQHFNMSSVDLHVDHPDSFIRAYLNNGCTPIATNQLSEPQKQKLGGWVKSLYESGVIDDELMSTCTPKEFHLLVATLFDQTLKACQSGVLAMDTIKGGLEYLLEPFLLPSLVTALGWAARVLWSTRIPAPHLDFLLPILTCLIRPASLSSDATAMHEAVLSIAARPLERALAHVQKLHPRRQDIDPLLNTLKARVQPARAYTTSHNELESWSTGSGTGGYLNSIRQSLQFLVTWSTTGSIQSSPPSYTHRQLLMGIQILGALPVLNALLDEALALFEKGSSQEVVLDIVSTIICAPVATAGRDTLGMRNALMIANQDAFTISKTDLLRGELIVRLQRRVEAQSPPKVEVQNHLAQNGDATMMIDAAQGVAEGHVSADAVDLEGIMKGVETDMGTGDFELHAGADGDASDLFGM